MKRTMKYETPEIEVTRFELERNIMADYGEGESDFNGDIKETAGAQESITEPGDLGFDW